MTREPRETFRDALVVLSWTRDPVVGESEGFRGVADRRFDVDARGDGGANGFGRAGLVRWSTATVVSRAIGPHVNVKGTSILGASSLDLFSSISTDFPQPIFYGWVSKDQKKIFFFNSEIPIARRGIFLLFVCLFSNKKICLFSKLCADKITLLLEYADLFF